jgi:hypothetical protein
LPTATATSNSDSNRADRGGLRRAAAPEASRPGPPANGAELRKQSLKTGVTGPRGFDTALAVPRSRRRKRSQPGTPPRAECQPARWSPRTGSPFRVGSRRRHLGVRFVRWGAVAKLGSGRSPQIPTAPQPARQSAGGLVGAGYWGSSGRTLAAWAPFGPDVTSNSTAWPSSSARKPSDWIALRCTKTSSPDSGAMKPTRPLGVLLSVYP